MRVFRIIGFNTVPVDKLRLFYKASHCWEAYYMRPLNMYMEFYSSRLLKK